MHVSAAPLRPEARPFEPARELPIASSVVQCHSVDVWFDPSTTWPPPPIVLMPPPPHGHVPPLAYRAPSFTMTSTIPQMSAEAPEFHPTQSGPPMPPSGDEPAAGPLASDVAATSVSPASPRTEEFSTLASANTAGASSGKAKALLGNNPGFKFQPSVGTWLR